MQMPKGIPIPLAGADTAEAEAVSGGARYRNRMHRHGFRSRCIAVVGLIKVEPGCCNCCGHCI
jgi:hypothetical protein